MPVRTGTRTAASRGEAFRSLTYLVRENSHDDAMRIPVCVILSAQTVVDDDVVSRHSRLAVSSLDRLGERDRLQVQPSRIRFLAPCVRSCGDHARPRTAGIENSLEEQPARGRFTTELA